eukprot:gnl/MRDRNA2_/MRDRNA2_116720_c0_seq1.p1 gnl/MRDRNA2_/MRDRNA2_116720_c0~~gnl/MRDRNA2_/MRDRNA2_116720_c0_seq1.p1  ORF type:complete len:747 (+),score=57.81 gnl/MRDRNA2_/MRDRNA2_116720_c0_seq1:155-2395(+)
MQVDAHRCRVIGFYLLVGNCCQACDYRGYSTGSTKCNFGSDLGVSFAQRNIMLSQMLSKPSYLNWTARPLSPMLHSRSKTQYWEVILNGMERPLARFLQPEAAASLTKAAKPLTAGPELHIGPTPSPADLERMMGLKIDGPRDTLVILHSFGVAVVVTLLCLMGFDALRVRLPEVYAARCVGEASKRELQIPFLPPRSWGAALAAGWRMQDQELLASSGLDGLTFLKFWDGCLKALAVSAVIICPVLFTSHIRGNSYHSTLLYRAGILNVPNASPMLWLDAMSVWVITLVFLHYIFHMHQDLARRRLEYLHDRPSAKQIFVYNIPIGSAAFLPFGSDSVEGGSGRASKFMDRFFRRCYPNALVSTEPLGNGGNHEPPPCGIVTFRTVRDAHICAQTQHGSTRKRWQVRLAPDCKEELLEENMTQDNAWSLSRTLIGLAGLIAVFCFWFIPVSAVCAMARLQYVEQIWPATAQWLEKHPHMSNIVEGLLSTAGLNMFMMLLPYMLTFLSRLRGHLLERDVDRSVQNMLFYFLLIFVLLVAALGQSVLIILVEFARSPERIVSAIGLVLPKVSNFYISYLILQIAILAFRLMYFYGLYVWFSGDKSRDLQAEIRVPLETWGVKYARWTIILVIALVYSAIAPVVLPLAVCVFALGYAVHSYELVFVAEAPFEIGGLNMPIATTHVHIGLAVHQFLMIALLITHGSRSWMLVAPLPVINYMFFDYCRATFKVRFLPLEDIASVSSHDSF